MRILRVALALCSLMLLAGASLAPAPAEARAFVRFGVGFGPAYYPPPPVYYGPPPVYYGPPPAYYAPPPVAYYAPPPVAYAAPAEQCREYQANSVVGGRIQPVFGTACRQPDGSWRIVR